MAEILLNLLNLRVSERDLGLREWPRAVASQAAGRGSDETRRAVQQQGPAPASALRPAARPLARRVRVV